MKRTQSDEEQCCDDRSLCNTCIRRIVDEAVKLLGGIDILILNAAYSPPPTVFTEYENPVRYDVSYITLALHTIHRVNCSLMFTSESSTYLLCNCVVILWAM